MAGGLLLAFSQWPFFWSQKLHEVRIDIGFDVGLVNIIYAGMCALLALLTHRYWRADNPFTITVILYAVASIISVHVNNDHLKYDIYYIAAALFALSLGSISRKSLQRIANIAMLGFIALSLPSVLIFLGKLFAIEIPSIPITMIGRLEDLYPFGVMLPDTATPLCHGYSVARIQGFSDEPGVIGTYSVFFLVLNNYIGHPKYKVPVSIALHILGTLSLSLFYFVIAWLWFLPVALWRYRQNREEATAMLSGIAVSMFIVAALFLFSKAQCGDTWPAFQSTPIHRLIYGSELGRNNRAQFDEVVVARVGGLREILFGNSFAAERTTGWTLVLLRNGLLGLAPILVFFAYILIRPRSLFWVAMVLPAVLSFYQREDFVMVPMMAIFWVTMTRFMPQAQRSTCPVPALNHF